MAFGSWFNNDDKAVMTRVKFDKEDKVSKREQRIQDRIDAKEAKAEAKRNKR